MLFLRLHNQHSTCGGKRLEIKLRHLVHGCFTFSFFLLFFTFFYFTRFRYWVCIYVQFILGSLWVGVARRNFMLLYAIYKYHPALGSAGANIVFPTTKPGVGLLL